MVEPAAEPPTMPLAIPTPPIPAPLPVPGQPGPTSPVLVRIGDITVTPATVHTPIGVFAVGGARWEVRDCWVAERYTPTWAIALSVLLACPTVLVSLFLLLVRSSRIHGMVAVSVANGPYRYTCHLPVNAASQITLLHEQANYARSLSFPT